MNEKELLAEVLRIPSRSLRELRRRRVIPFLKVGKRTILYDAEKVLASLAKFERTEAGAAK
jgi:hypothetical protein